MTQNRIELCVLRAAKCTAKWAQCPSWSMVSLGLVTDMEVQVWPKRGRLSHWQAISSVVLLLGLVSFRDTGLSEEGIRSIGTGVLGGCELSCVSRFLNLDPLQAASALNYIQYCLSSP